LILWWPVRIPGQNTRRQRSLDSKSLMKRSSKNSLERREERHMTECSKNENKLKCTCSYPCERKGMCCTCLRYHRGRGESFLPAIFQPRQKEPTTEVSSITSGPADRMNKRNYSYKIGDISEEIAPFRVIYTRILFY
jgi:hypothetical protein